MSCQAEVFMVLKDLRGTFTLQAGEFNVGPKISSQQITVFWKPPGASQWVEKYKTEVMPGTSNMQFTASLLIEFEKQDAAAILLKFEMRQLIAAKKKRICSAAISSTVKKEDEWALWSRIETTLDQILNPGPVGLQLPLGLDFGASAAGWTFARYVQKCIPGVLFLRGEILEPSEFGVNLQFGIQSEKYAEYFIEIHKLNQANAFELYYPYTLVYRSEINQILHLFPNKKLLYFPEARLTNGDFERVLKFDIIKKDKFVRKGFALTTLGSLLNDKSQLLKVERVIKPKLPKPLNWMKKKEIVVVVTLFSKIPVYPLEHFLEQGWQLIPIFAVDFSRSNWNEEIHQRSSLHDTTESGRTPYEEALELGAAAISGLSGKHAVFCGFGSRKKYMQNYTLEGNQVGSAIQHYQEALCLTLLSTLSFSQERGKSSAFMHGGGPLSPLLNDLVTLITRRKQYTEYYTIFILTDGYFSDTERYPMILRELSLLPVSLIFIAIGLGDLQSLIELDVHQFKVDGKVLDRKFIHLIHFRSKNNWRNSIALQKFVSSPSEIFVSSVLTTIREHTSEYLKRHTEQYQFPY